MNGVRRRLDHELETAVSRLRPLDGSVGVMDSGTFANEVDGGPVSESREIGFATRELLAERVKRLAAAIERLNAGEYGTCVECAAAIPATRLRATPEAQTCIRCQDRIERRSLAHAR